jgi:opacity protein-like surface antigen
MRTIVSCAAALVCATAAAHAQPDLYRFELTPTVSYRFGGTIEADESDLFAVDLEVEDDAAYGVALDIPLSSNLQLELLANRQESRLRFEDDLFGTSPEVADIDVSYYHVGLLWQWGDRRVTPFFVASVGATNLDPDLPGASDEDRFSVSLGGGVKVFVSENVGFRFEGRGFATELGDDDWDEDRCHHDDCYDDEFAQGQASLGLIVAW